MSAWLRRGRLFNLKQTNILRISTCMESRFAVESFVISAVGAELQLSYGRSQFCGGVAANFVVNWNLLLSGSQTS